MSDVIHPDLTEAVFQTRVLDLCRWRRVRFFHSGDSRRDAAAGFPDLVLLGAGGLVFAELKTQRGRVRPEQQTWLDALRAVGVEAYLWRPSDWPEIQVVIDRLARARP